MIPVDQTRFGGPLDPPPRGNCFAACMASVLEVPLDEIPDVATGEDDWMAPVRGWLARRNLQIIALNVSKGQAGAGLWGGYGLLLVPSRTLTQANGQPAWHQVVWYNGAVVHDPSPVSRALGTYTATDGVELAFFVALDPSWPLTSLPWSDPRSDPVGDLLAAKIDHEALLARLVATAVYLAPSPIHGVGVFAIRLIVSGEEILPHTTWIGVPPDDFVMLPGHVQCLVRAFRGGIGHHWSVPSSGLVDLPTSAYLNASTAPNVEMRGQVDGAETVIVVRALRDIAAGEELTMDYMWNVE